MDKPITVQIDEFKTNLQNLIGGCGLPAFIMEPILCNIANQVVQIAKAQADKDRAEYEKGEG